MALNLSTLRPGFLVSLKTSVVGNVKYLKQTIESDHTTEEGARRAKWETERTINDPVEFEAAQVARSAAYTIIRRVCTQSAFGLLCPEINGDQLERAIAEARKVAAEFNANAKLSQLNVYIMAGRIAPDDVEAVKAINSEVRELMEDMEKGLKNLDVKAVRAAASRVKAVGAMLSPDAASRVQIAVDAARESARRLVSAGEQIASTIDTATIRRIAEQRTAFLDMDAPEVTVSLPEKGRVIEFGAHQKAEG